MTKTTHHSFAAALRIAVIDAISEAKAFGPVSFADALRWIPTEFHGREVSLRERFIAAVLRNAHAACRSPYTVAAFALDI